MLGAKYFSTTHPLQEAAIWWTNQPLEFGPFVTGQSVVSGQVFKKQGVLEESDVPTYSLILSR
jgi:hypothetical protein